MTATLPGYCLIGDGTIAAWYDDLLSRGVITPDAAQQSAVQALQEFSDSFTAESGSGEADGGLSEKLRGWLGGSRGDSRRATNGIYFYGGVGRGKSFLMDGFYLQLPLERKLRAHFHQFMRHLHADMKAAEHEKDPLLAVASALAQRFDLICFDEFHVSDITDAMLLGRLLEILLAANTRFVMTSNYPPAGLYPNGLARERFLPTIALLESRFQLFGLDGDGADGKVDYRRRHLARQDSYFTPDGGAQMRQLFERLACGITLRNGIKLGGREVKTLARASDCVWFDFAALCETARGKEDYLHLAERYATVFLSGVPRLDAPELGEAARRFTWLIDILYDQKVKLILAAAAPLNALYGDSAGGESGRTLSRLIEMHSTAPPAASNTVRCASS